MAKLQAGDVVVPRRAGYTGGPLLVDGLVGDAMGKLHAALSARLPGGSRGDGRGCVPCGALRRWDAAKDGPLA